VVDSIATYVEKTQKLGAKLTKGKTAVPGTGWFAMFMAPKEPLRNLRERQAAK
jgi:predicted enzyme related to lactoylglutathione lyase